MKKVIFMGIVLLGLIQSCAMEKSSSSGWDYNEPSQGGFEIQAENKRNEGRKVIYNANITLRVKNIDSLDQKITAIAASHEGYVVKIGTDKTVFRVASYDLFMAVKEIEQLGKVEKKSIYGNDVSEEFSDLEIRLDNANRARNRYLEILERATTVEETLKVEKELERLNLQIEVLEGKINKMNTLVDLATIEVNYEKTKKPGILSYPFIGVFKAVKWLFVRG